MLGAYFPDWLTRFFLRTAKQGRLSEDREATEFFVAAGMQHDESLALFLKRFSKKTDYLRSGNPLEFVRELSRRWCERHPSTTTVLDDAAEMPHGAVFVSYAHEDAAAAQSVQLAACQRNPGVVRRKRTSVRRPFRRQDRAVHPGLLFLLRGRAVPQHGGAPKGLLPQGVERRRQPVAAVFPRTPLLHAGDRRRHRSEGLPDSAARHEEAVDGPCCPGGKTTPEFIANVKKAIAAVGSA